MITLTELEMRKARYWAAMINSGQQLIRRGELKVEVAGLPEFVKWCSSEPGRRMMRAAEDQNSQVSLMILEMRAVFRK